MTDTVLLEKIDDVAVVKFNRPRSLNAVTDELLMDFVAVLENVKKDSEIKVVIITGEGRAFCAGADIKEQLSPKDFNEYYEHSKLMQNITRAIVGLGKPTIAAVKGYAVGEGMEFSLNCDVRVVAEGTKVGFPESRVGATVTNGGTYYLPRIVGLGRAKEMVLTAELIDAQEAYRIGYANKVVPLEKLDEEALNMARKIASNYCFEVRLHKEMLETSMESTLERTLAFETYCACASFSSGSRKEGMEKARGKK
jgi:enoyl-CoA hydratase